MKEKQRIAIIGSTGSIGCQTLEVIERHGHLFTPVVLTAGSNVELLIQQAIKWRPRIAVIADASKYETLRDALSPVGVEVAAGAEAIAAAAEADYVDTVVTATVGYSGLLPTLRAVNAGKRIALANKETLVVAGDIVTEAARSRNVKIVPVDSEHSAIYQCLAGEDPSKVSRLIITASGGPFRTFPAERLATVTAADALRHPNWSMGAKITVDSATMMNKAFEIIEARWLFGVEAKRIVPVVHPQSIVHSMVEFADGSVKAQLGLPDMKLPISYALSDGLRLEPPFERMTLERMATLTFEEPDRERFPAITLADYALSRGGNTACVINAANEVAVKAFLQGRIAFTAIYELIIDTLARSPFIASPTLDDYIATNAEARAVAEKLI